MTRHLRSHVPAAAAVTPARLLRGGTFIGIVIGLLLGLAISLAVAVYVTKVPVPFINKGQTRTPEQDAAEAKKNKDWDPNAPLYGKNPARPPAGAASEAKDEAKADPKADAKADVKTDVKADAKADTKSETKSETKADPLGDLAKAKTQAAPDPFQYFLQVGAFRTADEAEAHRAKLSLQGLQTKVTEREQAGRVVFRVRMGPYERKDEADRQKEKLEAAGIESALVRVQR
jgi:cell division protein FtsN